RGGVGGREKACPPARPSPRGPPLRLVVHAGALAPPFARRPGEQPPRTVERATAALAANSEDVEAYHWRAHAHEALGDFARAEADLTQALKRQPANAHFLACPGTDRPRPRDHQRAGP